MFTSGFRKKRGAGGRVNLRQKKGSDEEGSDAEATNTNGASDLVRTPPPIESKPSTASLLSFDDEEDGKRKRNNRGDFDSRRAVVFACH